MNELGIDQLAVSWIAEWERRGADVKLEPSPSIDKVSDLDLDGKHEALWKFILETYPREMSPRVFAILAAGPLEDLLANFGSIYIDRVELLARQDPRFNDLLGGVWKNAMTNDVWERIEKARNVVW